MKVIFDRDAWEDYIHWQSADPKIALRINELIRQCGRSAFEGTGKPEPLRQNLKGWWSRRIDREHRLIYRVTGSGDSQALEILQCRYHY